MATLNKQPKQTREFSHLELKPGQTMVIFNTPEAFEALEAGLSDAETYSGRQFHKQAFKNSFIIKN